MSLATYLLAFWPDCSASGCGERDPGTIAGMDHLHSYHEQKVYQNVSSLSRKQERIKNVLSVYQAQPSQVSDQHFALAAS